MKLIRMIRPRHRHLNNPEPESYPPLGGHMGITETAAEEYERLWGWPTSPVLQAHHGFREDDRRTEVDLEDTAALARRYETAIVEASGLLRSGASSRKVIGVLDRALKPD